MRVQNESVLLMLVRRLVGIYTMRGAVYREIARDRRAPLHGWVIVICAAFSSYSTLSAISRASNGMETRAMPWLLLQTTLGAIEWIAISMVVTVLMRLVGYRTGFESVMRIQAYLGSVSIIFAPLSAVMAYAGRSDLACVVGLGYIALSSIQRFTFAQALEEVSRGKAIVVSVIVSVCAMFLSYGVTAALQAWVRANPMAFMRVFYQ